MTAHSSAFKLDTVISSPRSVDPGPSTQDVLDEDLLDDSTTRFSRSHLQDTTSVQTIHVPVTAPPPGSTEASAPKPTLVWPAPDPAGSIASADDSGWIELPQLVALAARQSTMVSQPAEPSAPSTRFPTPWLDSYAPPRVEPVDAAAALQRDFAQRQRAAVAVLAIMIVSMFAGGILGAIMFLRASRVAQDGRSPTVWQLAHSKGDGARSQRPAR